MKFPAHTIEARLESVFTLADFSVSVAFSMLYDIFKMFFSYDLYFGVYLNIRVLI